MEYLIGLLSGVVFFAVVGAAVYIGYRYGQKKQGPAPVDEEEQRKAEQFNAHFKELFQYDVDKALKRKEVE